MLAVRVCGVQLLAGTRHEAGTKPVQTGGQERVWCKLNWPLEAGNVL